MIESYRNIFQQVLRHSDYGVADVDNFTIAIGLANDRKTIQPTLAWHDFKSIRWAATGNDS